MYQLILFCYFSLSCDSPLDVPKVSYQLHNILTEYTTYKESIIFPQRCYDNYMCIH